MTSGSIRRRGAASSSRATRATSPEARTSRSSSRPVLTKIEWATCKLRRPFVVWLKVQAARRGATMGELVEEFAERAMGSAPWA
jgi:hypothetical protein